MNNPTCCPNPVPPADGYITTKRAGKAKDMAGIIIKQCHSGQERHMYKRITRLCRSPDLVLHHTSHIPSVRHRHRRARRERPAPSPHNYERGRIDHAPVAATQLAAELRPRLPHERRLGDAPIDRRDVAQGGEEDDAAPPSHPYDSTASGTNSYPASSCAMSAYSRLLPRSARIAAAPVV
jgi:hypothetical protein